MKDWHVDIHVASRRGAVIRELVRLRCTEPFDKWEFYEAADRGLRDFVVTYRDIKEILNQPDTGIARMRIRDLRRSREAAAA